MTGAEAVHPGYGFLSQDTYFAEICRDHDITFIGPSPEVMEAMGDKSSARKLMGDAGLPMAGGTEKPLVNYDEARERAEVVGYPIILKAVRRRRRARDAGRREARRTGRCAGERAQYRAGGLQGNARLPGEVHPRRRATSRSR